MSGNSEATSTILVTVCQRLRSHGGPPGELELPLSIAGRDLRPHSLLQSTEEGAGESLVSAIVGNAFIHSFFCFVVYGLCRRIAYLPNSGPIILLTVAYNSMTSRLPQTLHVRTTPIQNGFIGSRGSNHEDEDGRLGIIRQATGDLQSSGQLSDLFLAPDM